MSVMDKNRAITAEDLIRRYNLEGLKSDRKKISSNKEGLDKTDTILNNFINATTKNLEELQNQVDGNITTWFFNGVPTLENQPAVEWLTNEEKNNHLGDLYYDQDTGYAYRFTLTNNIYEWFKLTDSDITEALAIANSAQDTADSKRRVFVETPSPPYDVGDIWIKEDKELYRCRAKRTEGDYQEVDWIIATDYTNDDYAKNVEAVLNQFKTTVEENYTTKVQLETTKDSILGVVSSETTRVETTANNNYQDLNSKLEDKATVESVTTVTNKVEELQTSTESTIKVVEEIQINGVSQVKTETGYVFDKDGLHIDKTGAPTGSQLDEAGLEIEDKTGSQEATQFYSGYVNEEMANKTEELADYQGQTVTYSKNIIFNNYLETQNGRIENVYDDTYGPGIGFFIGGGS